VPASNREGAREGKRRKVPLCREREGYAHGGNEAIGSEVKENRC
jgi:hypothetical protein